MRDGDILILKGHKVAQLLTGQEDELLLPPSRISSIFPRVASPAEA